MNQTRLIAPRASSSISPLLVPLLGTLPRAGGNTGTKLAVLRKLERPSVRSPTLGRALRDCPSRCEQLAVGPAARRNYETAFGEFLRWFVNASYPVVDEKDVEKCLLGFLDHLLEEGAALHKAEIAIASVADAMPELGMLASRPRLRRALRGFRKQRPPRLRAPVAKEITAAIVNMLMNDGHSAMAFMVLIMFFSYCRPGEVRSLRRKQFLRPARARGPLSHWSIHLAPQSDRPTAPQQITKTGTMDDTVIMDRPAWMASLITKLCKGFAPDDLVFAIDGSLSVDLPASGKDPGPAQAVPLPVAPRRRVRGDARRLPAPGGHPDAGSLADADVGPPLRQAGAAPAALQLDARGEAGLRPQVVRGVRPACEARAGPLAPAWLDDAGVGTWHAPSGASERSVAVEIMAGSRRMVHAFAKAGSWAVSFEIADAPRQDVLDTRNRRWLQSLVKAGFCRIARVGLVCASWSLARRNVSGKPGFPPPLRDSGQYIWDLPKLSVADLSASRPATSS